MNRFEFPIAHSGTSEDDESNNLTVSVIKFQLKKVVLLIVF